MNQLRYNKQNSLCYNHLYLRQANSDYYSDNRFLSCKQHGILGLSSVPFNLNMKNHFHIEPSIDYQIEK